MGGRAGIEGKGRCLLQQGKKSKGGPRKAPWKMDFPDSQDVPIDHSWGFGI